MTSIQVLLAITVVSTGLFTGLLMTVLFFFERALKDLSGTEFAVVMQRFLKITRTHPLNYAMVLTSGFVPIAVLVMLRENPGSPSFVPTLMGLLAFWCGPVLISRLVAQPVYGVFMSWKVDAPPQDWWEARDRYFRANVVRGLGSALLPTRSCQITMFWTVIRRPEIRGLPPATPGVISMWSSRTLVIGQVYRLSKIAQRSASRQATHTNPFERDRVGAAGGHTGADIGKNRLTPACNRLGRFETSTAT